MTLNAIVMLPPLERSQVPQFSVESPTPGLVGDVRIAPTLVIVWLANVNPDGNVSEKVTSVMSALPLLASTIV